LAHAIRGGAGIAADQNVSEPLALALAFGHPLHFFLLRAARNARGTLGFGRGFLTSLALQALAFRAVFNVFSVHFLFLDPCYRLVSSGGRSRETNCQFSVIAAWCAAVGPASGLVVSDRIG
jgi:hypothetical protein